MQTVRNNKPRSRDLRGLSQVSGLSVAYWRKAISAGEIPARRTAGKILVLEEDFEAWLAGLPLRKAESHPDCEAA